MGTLDGFFAWFIRRLLLAPRDQIENGVHPATGSFVLLRLQNVQRRILHHQLSRLAMPLDWCCSCGDPCLGLQLPLVSWSGFIQHHEASACKACEAQHFAPSQMDEGSWDMDIAGIPSGHVQL